MRLAALDIHHKSDAAGVFLKTGVIKTLFFWHLIHRDFNSGRLRRFFAGASAKRPGGGGPLVGGG